MRPHEEASIPGIFVTGDVLVLVIELIVPEDLRSGRVGGANGRAAMKKAVQLIEVDGLGYIRRDARVSLSDLRYAIYKDGQQDGNLIVLKLPGHRDSLGRSPAMPVDNDARMLLFRRADDPIMIYVQLFQYLPKRLLPMRILKDLHVDSDRVVLPQMHGKLDLAMDGIVFLDVPSQKPDDDHRRGRTAVFCGWPDRGIRSFDACDCMLRREGCRDCRHGNRFGGLLKRLCRAGRYAEDEDSRDGKY